MAQAQAYQVTGDPRRAFDVAVAVLTEQGFRVGPENQPFEVEAERGSKGATVAFGAWAGKKRQHLRVTLRGVTDNGMPVVHYIPSTTGMAGGAIGLARANDAYNEIAYAIAQRLAMEQLLASTTLPSA